MKVVAKHGVLFSLAIPAVITGALFVGFSGGRQFLRTSEFLYADL